MNPTVPKSYLYAPADQRERLLKSGTRGADAVIADLEDAITSEARGTALQNVVEFLELENFGPQRWVRIHPGDISGQIHEIMLPGLSGIVLPEVSLPSLDELHHALKTVKTHHNSNSPTPVLGLIETAAAIRDIHSIAAHPRLSRLGMGEADLRADLGIDASEDERELLPLRSAVVLASAAAKITPPTASTSTNFKDLQLLQNSTAALARMGFRARTAIHPAQIAVLNQVFTPSAADITAAQDLIQRYEAAQGTGTGVTLDADGNMVDFAVVRHAYDVLSRAARPTQ